MSRTLSRVRALVSEIDSIQIAGRKHSSTISLVRGMDELKGRQSHVSDFKVIPLPPRVLKETGIDAQDGKIMIHLSGNVLVQLKIQDTNQILEVRPMGELVEIKFSDGKAIHLPIKNVS
jgi:hypothetical protein